MAMRWRQRSILPGFGPALGFAVAYLSLIVLIPLAGLFAKSATLTWAQFWTTVADPRVVAAFKLSLVTSFVAGGLNVVFGLILAWVLVRYRFPGRKIVDALVDLPFALPTAVAGITLTSIYAGNGWLGRVLEPMGVKVAFTWIGIVVALTFIGLPFVVRTIQPVLEDLEKDVEEAAACLGASRWFTLTRVVLPEIWPAAVTGFALAFARSLGEYGSVVFISGNMPMRTEIVPLLIVIKLEQFDYAGAAAVAVVMLTLSFAMLLIINVLQRWVVVRRACV